MAVRLSLTLFLAGLFLTVSAAATDSLLLFCGYLEEKGEPLLAAHEYGRYLSLSMDFQETIRLKQAAAFEKAGERQSRRINSNLKIEPADQICVSPTCLMFHPNSKSFEVMERMEKSEI